MEASSPQSTARSKKALENYASSYLGAYLNTVKKEHPERVPALARNEFYDVEVSLMPNNCFALVFEKGEKQNVSVKERDWAYVEGKAMSGISHMVAVYAHDGATVADAIARGKRDAIRDIRSLEDSNIGRAVTQLERILEDLAKVEHGSTSIAELGALELKKLEPVKDAVTKAGPELDMLAIIDSMKNYPSGNSGVSIEVRGKELLEQIVADLGDLSDLIRRVEAQDGKLEDLEKSLKKVLTEYNRTIDERISKGLAVILSSSDKKIDKGFAALGNMKKGSGQAQAGPGEPPVELLARMARMEKDMQALHIQLQEVASRRIPPVELPKDLEVRLDSLEKGSQAIEMQVLEKLSIMERRQLKEKEERDLKEKEQRELQEKERRELQEKEAKEPKEAKPDPSVELSIRIEDLKGNIERLDKAVSSLSEMKENVERLALRATKIEEFLQKQQASRQRTLKQKEPEQPRKDSDSQSSPDAL